MTDAERRQALLAEVRQALVRRDVDALTALLERLPDDSKKMKAARAEVRQALTRSPPPTPATVPTPARVMGHVIDERSVAVAVRRTGQMGLMQVLVRGGLVEVIVNRDHGAVALLLDEHGAVLQPAAEAIVAAWALLELEAGTAIRRDRLQDVREDLGRVLRRLARVREQGGDD